MTLLTNDKIQQSWSMIVAQGAGKEAQLLNRIECYLDKADIPGMSWKFTTLLGVSGNFLRLKNDHLNPVRIYLGARTYGQHLEVIEYFTLEPGLLSQFFSKLFYGEKYSNARYASAIESLSESPALVQEFKSFRTVFHGLCVEPAVQELVEILEQASVQRMDLESVLKRW